MNRKTLLINLFTLAIFCSFLGCLDEGMRGRATIPRAGQVDLNQTGDSTLEAGVRPSDQVFLQAETCGCQDGKPVTLGDCVGFCQNKRHDTPILYVFTRVSEALQTDPRFGNLYNWCAKEIDDGETNPSCYLEARSPNGEVKELVVDDLQERSLAFQVALTPLALNRTYVITLVESTSGARSNSLNLKRINKLDFGTNFGILQIDPIIQYSCLLNYGSGLTGDAFQTQLDSVHRLFFYYNQRTPPPPVQPVLAQTIYCHNWLDSEVDRVDRESYPRLESLQLFPAWSQRDFRFNDNDGDGLMDIMQQIIGRVSEITQTEIAPGQVSGSFFYPLKYPNFPTQVRPIDSSNNEQGENADAVSSSQARELGMLMLPFFEPERPFGEQTFCPSKAEYVNSDNPLIQAMGEVVGVGTQGLYFAHQSKNTRSINGETISPPSNFMLIPETILKNIWFTWSSVDEETGDRRPAPIENLRQSTSIHYYWPPPQEYLEQENPEVFCRITEEGAGIRAVKVNTCISSDDSRCVPHHLAPECNTDKLLFRMEHPSEYAAGGTATNFNTGHTYIGDSSGGGGRISGTIPADRKFACIPRLE